MEAAKAEPVVSAGQKPKTGDGDTIILSPLTHSLIDGFLALKKKIRLDDSSRIFVSRTVSFFALAYEKIRNAVEYREEHLIRRAAIERILKRRLLLNPEGKGEAENLIRELLWARYFPEGMLGNPDVEKIQRLINLYVRLRNKLVMGQVSQKRAYYGQFMFDLLTCEIEETLDSFEAKKNSLFVFFIYQVLKNKIKIENVNEDLKDAYFYVAVERGFAKSDRAYLHYHLFNLSHKQLGEFKDHELDELATQLPEIFVRIDRIAHNSHVDRLTRYVRKQMPPFLILFNVITKSSKDINGVLTNKAKLWAQVDMICREKYQQTSQRLRNLAIRSLIYIFLTKMIFALILEYPLSLYFYNEVNYVAIIINSLFPPLLMLVIILMARIPGEENTKRIFERIVNIIDENTSFEASVAYILKKPKVRRPMLVFGFTIFYTLTFVITLSIIHAALSLIHFNLISEIIFVFFISVVSFFGYRVTQIAREYLLQVRESFISPFVDFFFMPILSLGKIFNSGIAQLNIFIFLLDFLIEAPFKLIFEVLEEWISFVRQRKEEII